jgi:dTDP-glucose 4,6-dehydratase
LLVNVLVLGAMRLFVTGGCGFIGNAFIRYVLEHYQPERVTNVDSLTYAGSESTTFGFQRKFGDRYEFFRADIADRVAMDDLLSRHSYYAVINFAAESHVDRSIASPAEFIRTNIGGTTVLLETARRHGVKRLVQASTDEVYGPVTGDDACKEDAPVRPSSPYSASKAAADLLALAAFRTYDQDVVIVRSTNNFGPYQHPEKFIPLAICRLLSGQSVPLYGDGKQSRDWLHVEDHCAAVFDVLLNGGAGEIYNVASGVQKENGQLAETIADYLKRPRTLIQPVADRPGHDRRYLIDSTKIREQIGWRPLRQFMPSLEETIEWYRENSDWWQPMEVQTPLWATVSAEQVGLTK